MFLYLHYVVVQIFQILVCIFPETSTVASAAPAEEEEEDEPEVEEDDVPDLTSFTIDNMKQ